MQRMVMIGNNIITRLRVLIKKGELSGSSRVPYDVSNIMSEV